MSPSTPETHPKPSIPLSSRRARSSRERASPTHPAAGYPRGRYPTQDRAGRAGHPGDPWPRRLASRRVRDLFGGHLLPLTTRRQRHNQGPQGTSRQRGRAFSHAHRPDRSRHQQERQSRRSISGSGLRRSSPRVRQSETRSTMRYDRLRSCRALPQRPNDRSHRVRTFALLIALRTHMSDREPDVGGVGAQGIGQSSSNAYPGSTPALELLPLFQRSLM